MEEAQYEEWAQQYEKIGYSCYRLQGNKASSADFLKELMKGQQVMLGGNSGVGKSTVINALDASVRLRTGSISVAHQQGKHTTTFAEMHKLNFGAYVIDTPGIRSFGLVDLEKEHLGHYFPEIRAVMEACRFNNCLHLNEPGCAVRNAVQAGQIAQQRYRNYVAMVEEENDDPYRRNKFS
jgi:ribosome biogenesis GTPase